MLFCWNALNESMKCLKKGSFLMSIFTSHLSTHSFTTAKFPSPITLPTWYFSLMMEEETDRLPLTVRRRREGGDFKLSLTLLQVDLYAAERLSFGLKLKGFPSPVHTLSRCVSSASEVSPCWLSNTHEARGFRAAEELFLGLFSLSLRCCF